MFLRRVLEIGRRAEKTQPFRVQTRCIRQHRLRGDGERDAVPQRLLGRDGADFFYDPGEHDADSLDASAPASLRRGRKVTA